MEQTLCCHTYEEKLTWIKLIKNIRNETEKKKSTK